VLFAEPAHPYDDLDQPDQWAWRYGYLELRYTRCAKTLFLYWGPRYSIHGGKRCCRSCHGSGYLPWWERTAPDCAAGPPVRCPTCPTHRTLFEHLPLWPVHTLDRLRSRLGAHRHTASHPPLTSDEPGADWADDDNDEPPF
jgi:hypothetical protein